MYVCVYTRTCRRNGRDVTTTQRDNTMNHNDLPFKPGDRVQGQWRVDDEHKGQWYFGVIKSIDFVHKTIHIVFEDGDEDKGTG